MVGKKRLTVQALLTLFTVQDYMHSIGNYTQPEVVPDCYSRHSINFYETQWHQHQMELHHQTYPRSNTFSVISDISSDSSFSNSAPTSPAIPPLPSKRRVSPHQQ